MLAASVAFGSHTTTSSYTACYSKTNGAVRLIKEPGLPKGCPSGYTKFTLPDTAATEARATFTTDGPKPLGDHGDNSTWVGLTGDAQAHDLTVLLDSSQYPAGATAMLEVGFDVVGDGGGCVRVYDYTAAQVVSGSDVCQSGSAGAGVTVSYRLRSAAFSLSAGLHEYGLQG